MTVSFHDVEFDVYSAFPAWSGRGDRRRHLEHVADVATWCDRAGCAGALIYTDNKQLDPWAVAQALLSRTITLAPLVAVQPAYMHPFAAAKAIATLALLHERRVDLNFVAGGFQYDLAALGDTTEHDRRYDRLREYATIVLGLLREGAATLQGDFYNVAQLSQEPPLPAELQPVTMMSGSSPASWRCATAIGAIAVQYPEPTGFRRVPSTPEAPMPTPERCGMRIGVIARSDPEEAWREARRRFPDDSEAKKMHDLLMEATDSVWQRRLAHIAETGDDGVYWLGPYRTSKTYCPYLVGCHHQVAEYLERYLRTGIDCVILDEPVLEEDLAHAAQAFALAGRPG